MKISSDDVRALAPDPKALVAGKRLSTDKHWENVGYDAHAVWGECLGSARYQTRVALSDLAANCSCPSRKLPCKHALGLLLRLSGEGMSVPEATAPTWVVDWLERRRTRAEESEARKQARADKPIDAEAQAKRAEGRHQRVLAGLDQLDRWLTDAVRTGIARLDTAVDDPFETMARRMVDAQAPGLASRLRRLSWIPRGPIWPELLLADLGRLALISHCYRRIDALPVPLQADVRALIGYPVPQAEVLAHGDLCTDDWVVWGQRDVESERMRSRRNWLFGRETGRDALVLQFATGSGTFQQPLIFGHQMRATLAFYPGAQPLRALVAEQQSGAAPFSGSLAGGSEVNGYLEHVAGALAAQPFQERFACRLVDVTVTHDDGRFFVLDAKGHGLPIRGSDAIEMLSISSGLPIDVGGEYDGRSLRPLCVLDQSGSMTPLARGAA